MNDSISGVQEMVHLLRLILNGFADSMTMIPIAKVLISAMAVFMLLSACFATTEVTFMVVHKKASINRLKSGAKHVLVSIDIYNQGSSTAYDVTLTDSSWDKDRFQVVSGNTSRSWERLDAGAILSHSFELEAKVKGIVYGAPAVVTFRIPTETALQEAYSTPILPLDIFAERPPTDKLGLAKRLGAKYGSLISVISFVVLFIYLIATPSKSDAAKGSSKKKW